LEAFCASWDSDSKSWFPLIQEIEKLYVAQNLLEEILHPLPTTMEEIIGESTTESHPESFQDKE
jgi:hypothetical protein